MKVEFVILLFGGLFNLTAISFLLAGKGFFSEANNSFKICNVNNEKANSMPGFAEITDDLSSFINVILAKVGFLRTNNEFRLTFREICLGF